jgi:hypothetical protein
MTTEALLRFYLVVACCCADDVGREKYGGSRWKSCRASSRARSSVTLFPITFPITKKERDGRMGAFFFTACFFLWSQHNTQHHYPSSHIDHRPSSQFNLFLVIVGGVEVERVNKITRHLAPTIKKRTSVIHTAQKAHPAVNSSSSSSSRY